MFESIKFRESLRDPKFIGEVQILVSLIFFGISFIYQKAAMINGMSPISYNACRYVVSTALLFLYKSLSGGAVHRDLKVDEGSGWDAKNIKQFLFFGFLLGLANCGGSLLQQIGLVTVTAGKTGFITGMYVVFVPMVEYLIPCYNTSIDLVASIAALASLFGLYLLCGCAEQQTCIGGAIGEGEIMVFISMLFWVVSIIIADISTKKVDVVLLTCVDFSVTTIITVLLALYLEPSNWIYPFTTIRENWSSICIVGFTEAVAFLLSMLGQMYTPPTRASLLFSMEAAVCAIFAFFLLGEVLSWIEVFGGLIMMLAAIFSSVSSSVDDESLEATYDEQLPIAIEQKNFGST